MGKLQWLKTRVDLFLDPRVLYLLNQPNGDSYFVLWSYLKGMAGMVNDNGKIYVANKKSMTVSLIAKCLHRRKNFIEKGIEVLVELELIERNAEGMLRITNWNELQNFQSDEHRRELGAKRQQRYRERQRQAKETNMAVAEADSVEPPQTACGGQLPQGSHCLPNGEVSQSDGEGLGQQEEADTEQNTRPSDDAVPVIEPEVITEEPEIIKNIGHYRSVKKYQEVFHGINGVIAERLAVLEKMWGTQAACTAIDIAKKNRKNHVSYIEGILRQSNGNPIKEETQHERLKREQEEYYAHLNAMLQQNRQEWAERTENADDGSDIAAEDERYRLSGPYAKISDTV